MRPSTWMVLLAIPVLGACRSDMGFGREWGEALQMPAGISAAELPDPGSEGARLVTQYCSQCHGIPSPARHSAQEWPATVRRMAMRMEHSGWMDRNMGGGGGMRRRMPMGMRGAVAPTRSELTTILGYLQSHALQAISPSEVETSDDPAATIFSRTCARCHALPDPRQHPADEWPGVIDRMRLNMERLGVEPISDDEAAAVTTYLQRQAGG